MDNKKVTKYFSGPLMRQNIKANWLLCLAILVVMILMSTVMNYATSIITESSAAVDTTEYQEEFYTYLGALATYDTLMDGDLSYADFITEENTVAYETAFALLNAQGDMNLSVEGFQATIDGLSQGETSLDLYVSQFEYVYALAQSEGVFSQEELTISGMMTMMLEMMGIDPGILDTLSNMDASVMVNQMYFTMAGLLPILLLIVILANSVIAQQVDRGSLAYVLSTPTKRSAVAITQMLFLVIVPAIIIGIVCLSRIGTSYMFYDEVNVSSIIALYGGMYILVEAITGICYLASCWFSLSKYSLAVGGGLTVWFFLATIIGMFGSENMVSMGMGIEELDIFNKLTLIGLYDIESLATVGTAAVNYDFAWKLAVLGVIAIMCYVIGAIRFSKKDLPL